MCGTADKIVAIEFQSLNGLRLIFSSSAANCVSSPRCRSFGWYKRIGFVWLCFCALSVYFPELWQAI
jgi:hypothetical protein